METVEGIEVEYEGSTITLIEVNAQPYENCVFSSGFVSGHAVDTMYLRAIRDSGEDDWLILLRPDEMAAMAWLIGGTLWSNEMSRLIEGVNQDGKMLT